MCAIFARKKLLCGFVILLNRKLYAARSTDLCYFVHFLGYSNPQ